MIHYTYRINFLCGEHKGCYYIGKRSTSKYKSFEEDPYTGSGLFCQRYFKKYGRVKGVTYTKELLETADSDEKNCLNEIEAIGDLWRNDPLCMNMASGGKGWRYDHRGKNHPLYGKHHTEEARKKISEAEMGNKKCLGRVLSEETKRLISEHSGSRREDVKLKISEARKGQHNSVSTEFKPKSVGCYKDGQLVKEYKRLTDVKMDGFSPTIVCNCCKGRRDYYKGYTFNYL